MKTADVITDHAPGHVCMPFWVMGVWEMSCCFLRKQGRQGGHREHRPFLDVLLHSLPLLFVFFVALPSSESSSAMGKIIYNKCVGHMG